MKAREGFTLIEALVALAILAVMLGAGLTSLPVGRITVQQEATVLARDFQLARFEAINRNEFVGIELDPAASAYRLIVDINRDGLLEEADGDRLLKSVAVSGLNAIEPVSAHTHLFDPRGVAVTPMRSRIEFADGGERNLYSLCVSFAGGATGRPGSTCP